MAKHSLCFFVVAALPLALGLVGPQQMRPLHSATTTPTIPRRRSAPAPLRANVEEVSIAATQQLVALGVVAVIEGLWSSTVGGFTVEKALKFVTPAAAACALLVFASSSVSNPDDMAPGLALSIVASVGLAASLVGRLAEKYPERNESGRLFRGPMKESVALMLVVTFFGFSTAFQALFAAEILPNPLAGLLEGPGPGLPDTFPDMSEGLYAPMDDAGGSSSS
mmetsp:Transcript_26494/g.85691  ORF Transcript_26494/g.85691 Transcript_26494/m.85691 type:complete len:223 (-) Transcript_26494:2470-3138(-)